MQNLAPSQGWAQLATHDEWPLYWTAQKTFSSRHSIPLDYTCPHSQKLQHAGVQITDLDHAEAPSTFPWNALKFPKCQDPW